MWLNKVFTYGDKMGWECTIEGCRCKERLLGTSPVKDADLDGNVLSHVQADDLVKWMFQSSSTADESVKENVLHAGDCECQECLYKWKLREKENDER